MYTRFSIYKHQNIAQVNDYCSKFLLIKVIYKSKDSDHVNIHTYYNT